jgi:hypothetical protein
MSYDPSTLAMLGRALDAVLLEGLLYGRKSVSPLEIAEYACAGCGWRARFGNVGIFSFETMAPGLLS